jgi:hypothetical protein
VEAIINIDLYHIDPQGRSDLRLVVEAFADAECDCGSSGPNDDLRGTREERRTALLKECGL